MMERIIKAGSREGDLVADFFIGSGMTLKAPLKYNRRVLGVEMEAERFERTKRELTDIAYLQSKVTWATPFTTK